MTTLKNQQTIGERPGYVPKILQFGTGNFLRAFLGPMVEALNAQTGFAGSLVMVKATDSPSRAYEALLAQDGLYHLWIRGLQAGQQVDRLQLIKCVDRVIHPYTAFAEFLALATVHSIEFVVSNTTEAGIQFEAEDWPENGPARQFPGKLTQLLYARFRHFSGDPNSGWTILPCELIEDNGQALLACVLRYAEHWRLGEDFQAWLLMANHFCDTLVDRIVPGFPHQELATAEARIGYPDRQVVVAEPYSLWAIKAPEVVRSKLPLDQLNLNVQFTNDLDRYRTLKVRILNGAHTAMVPIGLRNGYETVGEFVRSEEGVRFVEELLYDEILPTLPQAGPEKQAYARTVLDRFRNPYLQHRLADIALNSIAKFRTRLWPSLQYWLEHNEQAPPRLLQAFTALLLLYRGDTIPLQDEPAHLAYFADSWSRIASGGAPDDLVGYAVGSEEVSTRYPQFMAQVYQALQPGGASLLTVVEKG
ncbi:MAG: tagaturonate reductase [Bacteroidetes bacterium]|nr:MAG: tagaturonate reductase [Bacteroidota bacterium]